MLSKEGCLARRRRLWSEIPGEVEWLLIADPRHVHYLCNFWVQPQSFSGGERGWLLLERDGKATLLADNLAFRAAAGEPVIDDQVIEKWYDHQHSVINRDHALLAALRSISERLFGRPGAVEAEVLPVGAWELLGLDREKHSVIREEGDRIRTGSAVDLGTRIRQLRRQKEADELALLALCMRATEAGHARAREVVREGACELDIFCEVQSAAIAAAGRAAILYGDFRAVNGGAPKRGGLPTSYRLKRGDMFILDYSVVIDGYRSDFTNTLSVGPPSDAQLKLYDVCRAAMKQGESTLRAGVPAKDVYNAVSRPMEESGFGPLVHHAGHGIGLAHPEPPILVPQSTDVLLAGDVVTLEPGLYVQGTGGLRIENNYLITDTGFECLSRHTISLT